VPIELLHKLVVQTYVQTHGHNLAHTWPTASHRDGGALRAPSHLFGAL